MKTYKLKRTQAPEMNSTQMEFNSINYDPRSTDTYEKKIRIFEPDNIEKILDLPYKKKTLRRYSREVLLTRYILNYCHTCQYTRKDEKAPISYFAMSVMTKGDKRSFSGIQKLLISNGIVERDNHFQKYIKAYHYSLGPAMAGVEWKKSEKSYVFRLPCPLKEEGDKSSIAGLTVDLVLLDKAMPHVQKLRGWTDDQTQVWKWYLTDDWDTNYKICKTGRVYGHWSNVPRQLRGCFLLDGKPVVEVDLANAQPMLLSQLYGDTETCGECERFFALVESGDFYENVMEITGMTVKDEIKTLTMKYICGGCGSDVDLIRKYFSMRFPFLAGIMASHQKDLYKKLALLLQDYESNIIVRNICEEFPVVSMHDSVICPADMGEMIRDRTKEVIKDLYNLDATIRIEDKRADLECFLS